MTAGHEFDPTWPDRVERDSNRSHRILAGIRARAQRPDDRPRPELQFASLAI